MADEKIQIGFRVNEAMRKRIELQCIKRDLSLQGLMDYALEVAFKTPVDWDWKQEIYVSGDSKESREQVAKKVSWFQLWLKYTNSMPEEKIEIMLSAIKWDLLNYGSSRRKRRLGK